MSISMRIVLTTTKAGTIKVKPLKAHDRLPEGQIVRDGRNLYIKVNLYERLLLGDIPKGYQIESRDKYEIIFKDQAAKPLKPKRKKKCI